MENQSCALPLPLPPLFQIGSFPAVSAIALPEGRAAGSATGLGTTRPGRHFLGVCPRQPLPGTRPVSGTQPATQYLPGPCPLTCSVTVPSPSTQSLPSSCSMFSPWPVPSSCLVPSLIPCTCPAPVQYPVPAQPLPGTQPLPAPCLVLSPVLGPYPFPIPITVPWSVPSPRPAASPRLSPHAGTGGLRSSDNLSSPRSPCKCLPQIKKKQQSNKQKLNQNFSERLSLHTFPPFRSKSSTSLNLQEMHSRSPFVRDPAQETEKNLRKVSRFLHCVLIYYFPPPPPPPPWSAF